MALVKASGRFGGITPARTPSSISWNLHFCPREKRLASASGALVPARSQSGTLDGSRPL